MKNLVNTLIVLAGTLFCVLFVVMGLRTGRTWMLIVPALVPLGIWSMNKPEILFYGSMITFFSSLKIPYAPNNMTVTLALQAGFIAVALVGKSIHKQHCWLWPPLKAVILLFVLNVGLVILFRGTGFRLLGDTNWGGFRYVPLLISAMFLLLGDFIEISPQALKRTIFAMLFLSFVPTIAEAVTLLSGGAMLVQYIFVQVGGGTAMSYFAQAEDSLLIRFQASRSFADSSLLLALITWYKKPVGSWKYLSFTLIGLAFLAGAVSGHRIFIGTGLMILFVFGWIWARQKNNLLMYFLGASIFAGACLGLAYVTASYLPQTIQRALAFLPGIEIDPMVEISADASNEWRFDMWREALTEVPEHLLVGKGFTYPSYATLYFEFGPRLDPLYHWAIVTSTYHNGILSLLIGLGLAGLTLGALFFVFVLYRHWKFIWFEWDDSWMKAFHLVFFTQFLVGTLAFFFIFGDVPTGLADRFFRVLLLEALVYTGKPKPARKNGTISADPVMGPIRLNQNDMKKYV